MENTGTICTTPRERSPRENGRRDDHQTQCYNCGNSGHLANVCTSKYKVATKTDKKEERNLIIYYIFTNIMLFLLIVLLILI